MGKFKVGDRVRLISYLDENVASGRYFNGEAFKIAMVNYHGGIVDPDGMTHGPQYLEHVAEAQAPIESPIRTVTRRELVPGVYGVILVNQAPSSTGNKVDVTFKHIDGHTWYDANELRSAAMILSQLAEALDDNAGKEK